MKILAAFLSGVALWVVGVVLNLAFWGALVYVVLLILRHFGII